MFSFAFFLICCLSHNLAFGEFKRTCPQLESTTLHLSCTYGARIDILCANYGRLPRWSSCDDQKQVIHGCKAKKALDIAKGRCQNEESCSLEAFLFTERCWGSNKYLEVEYECIEQTVIDPCSPNPCMNEGSCDLSNVDPYTCTCTEGFAGTNCAEVIDPCSPNPCMNEGSCDLSNVDPYTCTCTEGFAGTNCAEDYDPDYSPVSV